MKRASCVPSSVTYNRTLSNIKNVLQQHWHLLKTDSTLEEIFQQTPILAFRSNRNLKYIIGGNKREFNKVKRKSLTIAKGNYTPCLSNNRTLCCRQIIKTTTFQSNQNKMTYTIYHNVHCKSKYAIYLMECTKCKLQHVGKAETELNLRINNHRKDVLKLNAIPVNRHFAQRDHDFNTDARFTIIEKLQNTKLSEESITELLKKRANFWIKKLETLRPKGLNHELN